MSVTSRVEAYFSGVASEYQQASKGRVWGFVRGREARSVIGLLGDIRDADVLELGCGAGFYTRLLLAEGARHVWAVDLSAAMLRELPQAAVTPIQSDAASVEPGRRFDVLLSAGMLEFVDDPVAALRGAARCANPGARMTILFPTNSLLGRAYRRFHRRNGLAIGLFDRHGIAAVADEAGWTLEEMQRAGPYSAVARLARKAV